MRLKIAITLLSVAGILLCHAQTQELKLWYQQPANKWTEALPIGNGRLGAMIFGGIEKDRIQFNEETLWTGEPRDYNKPGASQHLAHIRQLLFEGKQKEAEKLAGEVFMGSLSKGGDQETWLKGIQSFKGLQGNPALQGYDDSQWKEMPVPSYEGWEDIGFEGMDGAVWFRTTFSVPPSWKEKDLVLDLNRIRQHDFTYINGKLVGSMSNDADKRKYNISKDDVVVGENTIAILVINYYDKGGIGGYKDTRRPIGLFPEGEEKNFISLVKNWKYFVQDDEPPATPQFQAAYQPFGDLLLLFKEHKAASGYKRQLDISKAISTTSYSSNGITYTREYFTSHPNQSIIVHLKASKPGSISFEAALNSPHKNSTTKRINSNTLGLSVKVRNGVLKGESLLQVLATKGTTAVLDDKIIVTNADEVTLYLTAGTNYKNYKEVTADPLAASTTALNSLKGKTYAAVTAAHIKDYQQLFNKFSISLGRSVHDTLPTDKRLEKFASSNDPSFAALYTQYGRYLLISSSRKGTRPANLQGIWNDLLSPPWGSKYTTNINAEMNYWPAELLNLSSTHDALFSMIEELAEAGKKTAKTYYDARGWVVHHNTDLWRGTAPINNSNHGIWVTGGAWLSYHLWERYRFTQDQSFLRNRAYPIMKDAALFFVDFLIKDTATGWLISTPSNSPEQGGLVAGPTMDHQIIRSLFSSVIEASALLNIDAALRDTLQQKLQQIAPNQVGKHGQLQEWLQDIDDPKNNHRHVSHLWGVHPGNDITWEKNAEMMKAARQSLLYRGDEATGWSLGWKINLWARFKDGDHAYKLVKMLLSPARGDAGSYPNLFDAHPPFQIDGNFGGAAGIGEMLVQSHTKFIDVLPALPDAFADGEVKGICARGGFVLNMKWKQGKLQKLEVLSKAGKQCVLRYAGKIYSFNTTKGKRYKFNHNLQKI